MEKILRVEKCEDKHKAGYAIVTDLQTIKLMIDNEQSCCEQFGYFMSENNLDDFIGAEILGISLTDTALKEELLKENDLDPKSEFFEGGIMFVDIRTDKGVLQFVAYNNHNGYYGHEACVISKQLNHDEIL